jgi:hypothetical protein
MLEKLANFLAQERVASVLLVNKQKLMEGQKLVATEEELKAFFNTNLEKFRTTEKRDFKYFVIDGEFFQRKKIISDASDTTKIKQLLVEHEKMLEDEVASGIAIEDIAKQLNTKLITVKALDQHSASQNDLFSAISLQLFELSKGELAYPVLLDNQKIILFKIEDIAPSAIPQMADIKTDVEKAFSRKLADDKTKEILEQIKQQTVAENFDSLAKAPYFSLHKGAVLSKNSRDSKYPVGFMEMIFEAKENSITRGYIDDKFGYIALVEKIRVNEKAKSGINKELLGTKITEGYYQELLQYLYKINDVKINYTDPIFKE